MLYNCISTVIRVYVLKTKLFCKLSVEGRLGYERCFISLCPLRVVFMFLKRN